MAIEAIIARAFQLLLALTGAYTLALWFALVVWTFRDIESRSRSVVAQILSTLVVVLFFVPGALIYLLLRPRETLDEAFDRALEEEYLIQDLENLSLCPTCHRPVEDEYVICPTCYTELRRTCPSCEHLVEVTWAICPFCTTELLPTTEEPEVPRLPTGVERPALLPLRMLRERTEYRVEHSLDLLPDEETRQLPAGQRGNGFARETHAADFWSDASGKTSWILSRVREAFRPLTNAEADAHKNGYPGGPVPPPPPARLPDHLAAPFSHWSSGELDAEDDDAVTRDETPVAATGHHDRATNGQVKQPTAELFTYPHPTRRATHSDDEHE